MNTWLLLAAFGVLFFGEMTYRYESSQEIDTIVRPPWSPFGARTGPGFWRYFFWGLAALLFLGGIGLIR